MPGFGLALLGAGVLLGEVLRYALPVARGNAGLAFLDRRHLLAHALDVGCGGGAVRERARGPLLVLVRHEGASVRSEAVHEGGRVRGWWATCAQTRVPRPAARSTPQSSLRVPTSCSPRPPPRWGSEGRGAMTASRPGSSTSSRDMRRMVCTRTTMPSARDPPLWRTLLVTSSEMI